MREITSHKINQRDEGLYITASDEPGAGNAHHQYDVYDGLGKLRYVMDFQNGPIAENGINGLTNEALLAIVIDRLECFQQGPYKCRENAIALTKLEEALQWLHHRTKKRLERGVEGTSTV